VNVRSAGFLSYGEKVVNVGQAAGIGKSGIHGLGKIDSPNL
jgi:hypothetical protein